MLCSVVVLCVMPGVVCLLCLLLKVPLACFLLSILRPPSSSLTDKLFAYTSLFRSCRRSPRGYGASPAHGGAGHRRRRRTRDARSSGAFRPRFGEQLLSPEKIGRAHV